MTRSQTLRRRKLRAIFSQRQTLSHGLPKIPIPTVRRHSSAAARYRL